MKRKIIVVTAIVLAFVFIMSTGCAKAEFEVGSLEISPSTAGTGDTATVKVDVTNVGKAEGTYAATLNINGVLAETKNVTVPPGITQPVTFSVVKEVVGDYTAEVGSLTGTLHVVKPAEFVVSNLRVLPAPEVGEGYYHITVDIENIGALKGVYQLGCKVNDKEMETAEVELTAGEKKTVTLIATESTIHELAVNYKNEVIDQRVHTVSTNGLSENVTFAARPVKTTYTPPSYTPPVTNPTPEPVVKLQAHVYGAVRETGSYYRVTGEVKNISTENLTNVEAVISFYTYEGKLMTRMKALINDNPLLPGKTSKFEVGGYADESSTQYSLSFQFSSGESIKFETVK